MSQVTVQNNITNGSVTLHTVTAGKILYINALMLDVSNTSGASRYGNIYIADAVPAFQYYIAYLSLIANGDACLAYSFPKALQIPAGYSVVLNSNNTNMYVLGFVHGFEV